MLTKGPVVSSPVTRAAGTGNTALAAARQDTDVTASDFAPVLLETAAKRAAVEGLELHVQVADAQHLPFEDDSFDAALSSFGAMYAPDQQRTADEPSSPAPTTSN